MSVYVDNGCLQTALGFVEGDEENRNLLLLVRDEPLVEIAQISESKNKACRATQVVSFIRAHQVDAAAVAQSVGSSSTEHPRAFWD